MLLMYVGKERRNRFVALALAVVLVAGVVLALLATVASAASADARPATLPLHATLTSIVPADGSHLDRAPTQIVVTFDEAVSPDFAQVVLDHDGQPVEVGRPQVRANEVTVAVTGDPGPGAYRIAFKVTSDDGHPVTGESRFQVGAPGAAGAPRPHVTPTYKTPQMQATTFGDSDHAPGLIVAGVLLLGGIALMIYERRRRAAHEDQPIS